MYGRSKSIEHAITRREGYLLRQIEEWSGQIGVDKFELAARLGALLLLGGQEGDSQEVRPVPVQGPKLGKQLRHMEVHSRPHSGRPRGRPRKVSMSGIKAYWAKMTPEERMAEMKRRGLLRKKKAA